MANETFTLKLPEVGIRLVYDADASPPPTIDEDQFDLARATADYLSLESLIKTLEEKRRLAQEKMIELAGDGIRYIKKTHGRIPRLKTIGVYCDWEIDLDKLREQLTEVGRPDIYEQCLRRGAPGRFVATYSGGNREEVLSDLMIQVEPLGVQIKPFDRQVEYFAHMPTLKRLCFEDGIKLRDVRIAKYRSIVYKDEPATSR